MAFFRSWHCDTKLVAQRYCVQAFEIVRCVYFVDDFVFRCDETREGGLRYHIQKRVTRNALDILSELEGLNDPAVFVIPK